MSERKSLIETLQEPTCPAEFDQQLEASLGWRSEMTPSSVGSEWQSRVKEPRNRPYWGSPRVLVSVGRVKAPQRSGAEIRPGSESRAKPQRVSQEAGRASCFLGEESRRGLNRENKQPEERATTRRWCACENSREAKVSNTERQSEGGEKNRGSLSRCIVAVESGGTKPEGPRE
jgi:hypothetical protein